MGLFKKKNNTNAKVKKPTIVIDEVTMLFEANQEKRNLENNIIELNKALKSFAILATKAKQSGASTFSRAVENIRRCAIQIKQTKAMIDNIDMMVLEQKMDKATKNFLGSVNVILDTFGRALDPDALEENADKSAAISKILVKIADDVDNRTIINKTSGADTTLKENTISDEEVESIITAATMGESNDTTNKEQIPEKQWEQIKKNIQSLKE